MIRCTRCELPTACHTLLDDNGAHPICAVCIFLSAHDAEREGEIAMVSFAPRLSVVR